MQDLLLLHRQDALFFQGPQGGGGGPGEIAQLLGGGRPQGTQQLHHRVVQGGGLPPGGHQSHGVLRRDGQHRQPLPLVPHLPMGVGLQPGRPRLGQPADGGVGVPAPEGQADLLHVPLAAPAPQHVQQFPGGGQVPRQAEGVLPVQPLLQHHPVPQREVQSGGEHGLHAVVDCAEVPLPHPEGQLDGLWGEHRLLIQGGEDLLQDGTSHPLLPDGEHHAVRAPVARPEGDQHPHTGPEPPGQLLPHQIVIGPVDGVHRSGHRHLCNDPSQGRPLHKNAGS